MGEITDMKSVILLDCDDLTLSIRIASRASRSGDDERTEYD